MAESTKQPERVVVAGGAGYIGTTLVEMLVERGYQVTVLDRFYFGEDPFHHVEARDRIQCVRDDTRRFDPKLLEGAKAVIDLAGVSNDPACDINPDLTSDINRNGGLRIAKYARENGVRLIYSGSCSVYGFGGGNYLDEESECTPVSLYAQIKLELEREFPVDGERRPEVRCAQERDGLWGVTSTHPA